MAAADCTLPRALANPPGGRFDVEDAIRVWMCAYYGVRADADPKDHERECRKARADLRHLIKSEVVRPANPVLAALGRKWQCRGSNAPRIGEAVHAHWIEKDDLEGLARERGFSLFGTTGRPKTIPDDAVQHARNLLSAGMTAKESALQAAEAYGLTPTQAATIGRYLRR